MRRRDFLQSSLEVGAFAGVSLLSLRAFAESNNVALAEGGGVIQLAVIVSRDSKLWDISSADLKRIFLSERLSDPSGNKFIPLNHPPKSDDRVGFDRSMLGMNPEQVGRFWIDRKIRGGAGPPRTVDSIATLRRVVARLPGGIGYLRPVHLVPDIKALKVDGRLPGDPSYPVTFRL